MGPIKLKARLLKYAKSGGDRTKLSKNHKLRLYGYMRFKSKTYDINFCRELYATAPQWFKYHSEKDPGVDARKAQMIEAAGSGMTKKEYRIKFGNTGLRYLKASYPQYDSGFVATLFKVAPTWDPKKRVALRKARLLAYAESGAELPKQHNNSIRATLNNYTRTEYPCFDAKFRKQVQQIRPEWFGA